ncbi:PDR/VanB family oxidoreductase [Streptomyces sp. NPDC005805]|uniref:PDR/VanB family oxidoreductase n=1 Tax=Streptomyces sp. NPDC005805 TaxID=3157068 RepID=UPI0033CB8C14
MPRLRTAVLVAGAALLARRAARRRIRRAPLWPMPALATPVSGQGRPRTPVRRAVVTARTEPAEGVVRLRLEAPGLPAWEPGAHIDLVLPSGLVRPYSLCGDPAEADVYTVAVRRVEDGRGGSREVHEQLTEGTELEIRGPRNRFPLAPAPGYLFVAGGIGITPVLPMVRAVAAAGLPWRLLYCGRSRASMPFLGELTELARSAGRPQAGGPTRPAGSEGPGGRLLVVPEDEDGLPDLAAFLAGTAPGTAVHTCGPAPLMAAVGDLLPAGCTLRLERFAAGAATAAADPGTAFEVELRRTGAVVPVAAGQSVLAAVRERLPDVLYSCEQGFCGTCRQRVLDGEVDHRDELLGEEERKDAMLLCVSRCHGKRLVLDL